MGTPVPATSTGCLHPWDQNTPRPWLTRNWFLLWQRWINLGKLTLSIGHTFNDQFTLGKIINLFIKRETRSTTPMKRTLLLSIYTLETQLCLVISLALSSWTSFYSNIYMLFEIVNSFFPPRVWESSQDDLVGLHIKLWRDLWTLPWHQFCFRHRARLLVHC